MKFKEELVKAVLNRELVIEHTRNKSDNPKLIALLKFIFPDANYPRSNEYNDRFYGAYLINNKYWDSFFIAPKGVKTLPLIDFIDTDENNK